MLGFQTYHSKRGTKLKKEKKKKSIIKLEAIKAFSTKDRGLQHSFHSFYI